MMRNTQLATVRQPLGERPPVLLSGEVLRAHGWHTDLCMFVPEEGQDVKQFARCTHCRQWYVQTFTTLVEISPGHQSHRVTVWCLRCIDEAEQRSRPVYDHEPERSTTPSSDDATSERIGPAADTLGEFQQLMQQHNNLMDRAIHEEDAVLIPLVEDFMLRCRTSQQASDAPEQTQRLTGHLQYWEAFLKALNQS